ncbi:MAG: hypothetical protein E6Q97_22365 [Desulfurellales bacterium]|nr:MAG: hypothetical protein E6Q97_22365 [Desulfurellales bacterium]
MRLLTTLTFSLLLSTSFAHAAMGPLPQCLGSEAPDPCGRTIIARGSLELRPDGSVEVYNASGNVLGAAYTGGGKVQVLMSETTAAEYQVLLSGSEEVPSGRTPQIGRFDKWARYFRITPASPITCKQWIDFVVVGR